MISEENTILLLIHNNQYTLTHVILSYLAHITNDNILTTILTQCIQLNTLHFDHCNKVSNLSLTPVLEKKLGFNLKEVSFKGWMPNISVDFRHQLITERSDIVFK